MVQSGFHEYWKLVLHRHQILVSHLGYRIIKPKKIYITQVMTSFLKIFTALQQQIYNSILYPGKFACFTFDAFEEKAFLLHRVESVVSVGNSMEQEVALVDILKQSQT